VKNTTSAVIETEGLTKIYEDVHALKSLDLTVPRHSITGFLGPNGAGKSTTIKLLLGLIYPTAGKGQIFGMDITQESTAIRERVGYLPQHPTFYPNLTARETLRFVAGFFSTDTTWIEERVNTSLALVGLESKADRSVAGFSGGETQRLGLAQAQINEPDLLILDEPAAALDPMGRARVLDIMERLRERSTIFYSTHILDDVQRVSDRVAILNNGRLVTQGAIADLLAGDTGIVYQLSLQGAPESAYRRVKAQPWVSNIETEERNGTVEWHVAVSDEGAAKHQLLRLILADEQTEVLNFERSEYELEDVFMQLVKEAPDG
jgi:ABC-2 type transport system ATP-binding protein